MEITIPDLGYLIAHAMFSALTHPTAKRIVQLCLSFQPCPEVFSSQPYKNFLVDWELGLDCRALLIPRMQTAGGCSVPHPQSQSWKVI
jgi:hypothetical protein